MRLLSYIYCLLLSQTKKESMEFFWTAYNETRRQDGSFKCRFYGTILHRMYRENGANIPIETRFGDHPMFPHGLCGIFISKGAVIGRGCVIFQQVTIGSNTLKDSKGYGSPVLGDNVYIGAGAKIIGNVHIGNNCRIGANCVVTIDMPDNTTAVMPHPILVKHEERNNNIFTAL